LFSVFLIIGILSFLAANLTYWVPAWLGQVDSEISSWSRLFIDTWSIIGFIAGSFAVIVSSLIIKSNKNAS
jgi:hypothetical protein